VTCLRNDTAMRIFLVLSLLLLVFCQNAQNMDGCKSGSIPVGSLPGPLSKAAAAAVSDLPPEFHYSSLDMEQAICGAWLDRNSDTVMTVTVGQDAEISYNITGEHTTCGPTFARLPFLCSSPSLSFSGSLTFYESADSGEVEITIADRPYLMKQYKIKDTACFALVAGSMDIPPLNISRDDSLHRCQ